MSFLHPHLLMFLPLALTPVIIYYLFFRKSVRIKFSSLFILKQVYKRNIRRWRLKQFIVILLRFFALVFLVCAFARPVIKHASAYSFLSAAVRDKSISLVMLMDVSYSMKYKHTGKEFFDIAKDSGISIIRKLEYGDKIAVGAFSDRWESPPLEWTADFVKAENQLNSYSAKYRNTDYKTALEKAFSFLADDKSEKKVILVLTDSAKNGFSKMNTGIKSIDGFDAETEIFALSLPKSLSNTWIENIQLKGADLLKNEADISKNIRIECEIKNVGKIPANSSAVLDIKDIKSVRRKIHFDKKTGISIVKWFIRDRAEKNIYGKIKLKPDLLSVDDVYYFSYKLPSAEKLLCLYSDSQFMRRGRTGHFLKSVIGQADESVTAFQCDFADLSRIKDIDIKQYSGIILAGFSRLNAEHGAIIKDYVLKGGRLLIVFGPLTEPTGLRAINEILPAEVHHKQMNIKGTIIPESDTALSPLSDFSWKGFETDKIQTESFMFVSPKKESKVLWWISTKNNKYPAFIEWNIGGGAVYIWTSGLETAWTNFALKPSFPAWTAFIAAKLAKTEITAHALNTSVGNIYHGSINRKNGSVKIISPDKKLYDISVSDGRFIFAQTDIPGIYKVIDEGSELFCFAVNGEYDKGESSMISEEKPPWKIIQADGGNGDDFFSNLGGAELRTLLFFAALLFLFCEFFITRS